MLENSFLTEKIYSLVSQAEKILLVAHLKPDGDTLGATAAMSLAMELLNKDYQIYCEDSPPAYFNFLPNISKFTTDLEKIKQQNYSLIITIDCADLKRSGIEEYISGQGVTLINIDHHKSNPNFGQYNLVYPNFSSTAEIIYNLLLDWRLSIDKKIATCLLNGIFTDTGVFTNAGANLKSLNIAEQLLNFGGRLQEINEYNLKNKSLDSMKLWGRALERLTVNKKYNLAYTIIMEADLKEFFLTNDDLEGLSNFLNNLSEVKMVLVLKESQGLIRGSLRTNVNFDVSQIAKLFGGGGHPKASGFSVPGKLVLVKGKWKVV